jgi:hypothetical protein
MGDGGRMPVRPLRPGSCHGRHPHTRGKSVSNGGGSRPNERSSQAEATQDNGGLWRIGRTDIESYIKNAYQQTAARIAAGELQNEQATPE